MSKPAFNLPDLKNLMHYFGYEYVSIKNGTWEFTHKVFPDNRCLIKQRFGGEFIASLEFWGKIGNHQVKHDAVKPKKWFGLFTAVRNHTKSLIFKREVINQHQKQAA